MALADYLPYVDANVREQINRLFSRKMLGSVLVGKFVGDYTALWFTRVLGADVGYSFGIVLAIAIFIYWERLERRIEQAANEISESQKQLEEYNQ